MVVCSRLKLLRAADGDRCFYLTNTAHTQVYCTGEPSASPARAPPPTASPAPRPAGLGQHPAMGYRKLHPVRHFLLWLKGLEEQRLLSRAALGGFFTYPPPPVSLATFMKKQRGGCGGGVRVRVRA